MEWTGSVWLYRLFLKIYFQALYSSRISPTTREVEYYKTVHLRLLTLNPTWINNSDKSIKTSKAVWLWRGASGGVLIQERLKNREALWNYDMMRGKITGEVQTTSKEDYGTCQQAGLCWAEKLLTNRPSRGERLHRQPRRWRSVCFFNLQLRLAAVSIKLARFSAANVFLSSSKQVGPGGMSWFLCGQIEMSELALEQKRWRRSERSGKANELSDCCHTRWQTGWRVPTSHTSVPTDQDKPSWTQY